MDEGPDSHGDEYGSLATFRPSEIKINITPHAKNWLPVHAPSADMFWAGEPKGYLLYLSILTSKEEMISKEHEKLSGKSRNVANNEENQVVSLTSLFDILLQDSDKCR